MGGQHINIAIHGVRETGAKLNIRKPVLLPRKSALVPDYPPPKLPSMKQAAPANIYMLPNKTHHGLLPKKSKVMWPRYPPRNAKF